MAETEKKEKTKSQGDQKVESKNVLEKRHFLTEARVTSSNVHAVQKGLVSASGVQQTRKEIEQAKSQEKEKSANQ